MPASTPTSIAATSRAVIESVPQASLAAIDPVPSTWSVQVPGQATDPSSQAVSEAPVSAIWPVPAGAAQISRLEHERSPAGHHADPGQLAESSALGAVEQGAANQVRLLGESAATLGGHGWSEHG